MRSYKPGEHFFMDQQQEQQHSLELTSQLVTIMTTEHYTLQSAQAQEVADINGRNTLFIGAVSSALIALAFIGQVSHLGTAFFVFSLVLFPSLFFMGLVTFVWVVQATDTIIIYGRGINRIRHLYLEYAPQMQPLHTCVISEPLRTKQHALSDMRRRKQSQDILGLGRT
jgi:hypothetical protein